MSFRSLLALSAGVSILALSAGADARQATPADEAAQLAESHEMGKRCGWLIPVDAEALRLVRAEQLALVESQSGAAGKAAVEAAAQARVRAVASAPCTGAEADKRKAQALSISENLRYRLLLRANALGGFTESYAYEITTVGSSATALRGAVDALKSASAAQGQGPAFDQLNAQAVNEARVSVNIICPERKNVRSLKGPRACPAVSPADAAMAPYARALIASAEAFAPAYVQAAQAEQQAQADAKKAQEANAEAARKAAAKQASDKAIAKYGDMSRYWKADFWATNGAGEGADVYAECTGADLLLDLGKDAKWAEFETLSLVYAPTVKLDGGKAPEWAVYSQRTYTGRDGRLSRLNKIDTGGFTPEHVKAAFDAPPFKEDPDVPAYLAAIKPLEVMYLDEFHMRALAASINGDRQEVFRQCRGR